MPDVNSNYNVRTGYEDQVRSRQADYDSNLPHIQGWKNSAQSIINGIKSRYPDLPQQINSVADVQAWANKLQSLPNGHPDKRLLGSAPDWNRRDNNPGSLSQALFHLSWWSDRAASMLPALNEVKALHSTALGEMQGSLAAMKKLLETGDIEGAVMLLQTTRVKVLDDQLKGRIAALQERNVQVQEINNKLAQAQKELAGDKDNGDKQKKVTELKGQLDRLNSDSQLDMIGIQSLVNKRNEAFDLLSNLLNKFQKTTDGIVANIR